jgi:prepilin-type N-terminal cleavage/methylation domain-containing protein
LSGIEPAEPDIITLKPMRQPSEAPVRRPIRGFSLVEILVTIALIAILTAIAIPVITRVPEASRQEVAENMVARINAVVTIHRQTNVDFVCDANNSDTSDEAAVMNLLMTRDEAVPGSPLLSGGNWPSVGTSDNTYPRMRWNGRFFELIPVGADGNGLRMR